MHIRKLLFLLVLLSLISCSLPSYVFKNPVEQPGLNFTEGRWLLNDVGMGYNEEYIYEHAQKDFKELIGDSLSFVNETKGLLLPPKIPVNPTKAQITDLYNGTKYDYFINIKTNTVKDNLSGLTNHRFNDGDERINNVTVEVYNLKLAQIVYSQTVEGYTKASTSNSDVNLYKSNAGLQLGCYNRIMKDIKKKSQK